jgi:hypothetical protein
MRSHNRWRAWLKTQPLSYASSYLFGDLIGICAKRDSRGRGEGAKGLKDTL